MKLWAYLEGGGKRAVEVAHRRWGKDDIALNFTARAAFQRIANYWHMLPQAKQARKVVWDAVNPRTGQKRLEQAFPLWLRKKTSEQEMMIEFINGSTWQLVGSDNYEALVGSPPAGIVLSEWAIADPLAWAYLSPILEENEGWALFIYTSRGMNHGKTMFDLARTTPGWFAEQLSARQTPVFTAEQLERIRDEKIKLFGDDYGEMIFQQEYMSSFAGAVLGAYFAKQMLDAREQRRIGAVPWQPGQEVDTFWDLGVDDSTTIWFMQPGVHGTFNFIDYYEASGYGMGHYAKVLKDKPYVYGNHYMPHDANKREMSKNEIAKSIKQTAEELGVKPVQVVSRVRNMDIKVHVHIPAARNTIPLCWFDEVKCARGIAALEGYCADYDEEKKKLDNHPTHDWTSHAVDAFFTFTVGYEVAVPVQSVSTLIESMGGLGVSGGGGGSWYTQGGREALGII